VADDVIRWHLSATADTPAIWPADWSDGKWIAAIASKKDRTGQIAPDSGARSIT
jgi:hypothetical protein